jgi:hypothetical protein
MKLETFTARPQAPAYQKAGACGWEVNIGVD